MKQRIVLLGSGYTSVWAYKYLLRFAGRRVRSGALEIIVVTDSDGHSFHGFTGEFLTNELDIGFRTNRAADLMPHAKIVFGRVVGLDPMTSQVQYCADGVDRTLSYDHVVVGVGSVDRGATIPGLFEFGFGVKSETMIQEIRARISEAIDLAMAGGDASEVARKLDFTIVGGGFAAVEVAASLSSHLRDAARNCPQLKVAKVRIAHPGKEILSEIEKSYPRLHRYAVRTLADLGVPCRHDSRVARLESDRIHFEDGSSIATGTVIYAIGQQRVALPGLSGLVLNLQGKLLADPYLRAEGHENVWVGGDCASVRHPFKGGGSTCRQDALWAVKHGTRIGKNLARVTQGRRVMRFRFPGLGQVAGFGRGRGILEIYGIPFTGPLAWALRAGFFLYFYPSLKRVPSLLADIIFGARASGKDALARGLDRSQSARTPILLKQA